MRGARGGFPGLCLLVALSLAAPEAWAYLDPSTGSMLLTAIIGMFATAALAVKTFWYKLKGLFRRDSGEKHRREAEQDSRAGPAPGPD